MPRRLTDADYRRAAKKAGIPYNLLVALLGQEGGTDARGGFRTSPAGARGPAQLMPGTARRLEQSYGINTSTPFGNLLGGAYYLAEQKKRFGSWRLALAAYNAGPGAVERYHGVPPYAETQRYVRNILTKAGVLGGRQGKMPASAGVGVPSGPGAPSLPALPAVPSITPADVALQGVRDIAEGDWNPTRALQGLVEAQRAAEVAMQQQAQVGAPGMSRGTPTQSAMPKVRGDGITYAGQHLTHETAGLEGYPAVDLFAAPGTPFIAPEDGVVIKYQHSRGGTSGQVFGWGLYFKGKSGRTYFITHLNKNRARVGTRVKAGGQLGTVSPWDDGRSHAHVGINEPRRGR